MKKTIYRILELALMIGLSVFVINKVSLFYACYGKDYTDPDRVSRLAYEFPSNSIDIVFLGDSHSYCTYVPKKIFEKIGVSSVNLSTSSSSVINAYWELKEMMKTQNPKIVVLELHTLKSIYDKNTKQDQMHITSSLYMMPDFSINKYKCLYEMKKNNYSCSKDLNYMDVMELFVYKQDKDRKEIINLNAIRDFIVNPQGYYKTFGYLPSSEIHSLYIVSSGLNETYIDLKKTTEFSYLEKIYELCKQNNIDLILSFAPFYNTKETGNIYKQIFYWADKNSIKYINYFDLLDEIDLDLRTDFKDSRHLNYWGAKKITYYFIEYINKYYKLEDHRGDDYYLAWENSDYDYDILKTQLEFNEKVVE